MSVLIHARDILSMPAHAAADGMISTSGTNFLWAVMSIHILSFLIVLSFCFTTPDANRVFLYTYTFVLLVASTTTFAQASGLGFLNERVTFTTYINDTLLFSAHALTLGLLSGISWVTILLNLATAVFWVACYFAGALASSKSHTWGFFAFGTFAFIILAMSTLNECREAAERRGIAKDYMYLATWVNALWPLYIVAWALGDGAHVLSTTASAVWVGVLRVFILEGTVFGFIWLGRNWDFGTLSLAFGDRRLVRSSSGTALGMEEEREGQIVTLEL